MEDKERVPVLSYGTNHGQNGICMRYVNTEASRGTTWRDARLLGTRARCERLELGWLEARGFRDMAVQLEMQVL